MSVNPGQEFAQGAFVATALAVVEIHLTAQDQAEADRMLDDLPDLTVALDPSRLMASTVLLVRLLVGDVAAATGRPDIDVLHEFRASLAGEVG